MAGRVKSDDGELVLRVVDAVRAGGKRFDDLRAACEVAMSSFRDLDRALQKARRAGLIKFSKGKGWEVV